jgi:copper chaperone CopZ
MRNAIHLLLVWALLLLVGGCKSTGEAASSDMISSGVSHGQSKDKIEAPPNAAVMWVHGMGCPQCAYNVDRQLLKLPGVEGVKVDMSTGKVYAQLSPSNPPTKEQLSRAIMETGFTLKKIQMP